MRTLKQLAIALTVLTLALMCFSPLCGCKKKSDDDAVIVGSSNPPAGTPGSAWVTVTPMDKELAKQWNDTAAYPALGFPYKTYFANSNSTVPINRVVLLQGNATPPTGKAISGYAWAGIAFTNYLDAPVNAQPYFTPAAVGDNTTTLTVTFSDGSEATSTKTIVGATYLGKANCSGCHATLYNNWLRTGATDHMNHASAFEDKAGGKRTNQFAGYCFACHTTGYDYEMLGTGSNPDNAGSDDASRHGLSDDGTSWSYGFSIGLSGHYEYPSGSGVWSNHVLGNQPAGQRDLNGIQCEQCHGPGSMHYGDSNRIGIAYDEATCTSACHGRGSGDFSYDQSAHSHSIGMSMHKSASCNECHTTQGFIHVQDKGLTAESYDLADDIACAACHNVHHPTNEYVLRFEGEVDVSGTSVEGHASAVCIKCHTAEDPEVGHEPHHTQAEMFFGTTIGGGKGYQYAGKTYTNMGHTTGAGEGCVECHMAPSPGSVGRSDIGYNQKTLLVEAITSTTGSFAIGSATEWMILGGGDTIRIDEEQMVITSVSSSAPYTVVVNQRGANGTTATAHTLGALVTYGSGSRMRIGGHSWNIVDDVLGNDESSFASITTWVDTRKDNYYNVEGCNECHRQFSAPEDNLDGLTLRTNVSSTGLSLTDTIITVTATAGFPASGTIQIGSEQITYSMKTDISFGDDSNPVGRGANGTSPAKVKGTAYTPVVSTALEVGSTALFPDSGVVEIKYDATSGIITEYIAYTIKTATTVTGMRGANSSTITQHPNGITVTLLKGVQALLPNPGIDDATTTLPVTVSNIALGAIQIGNDAGWPANGVAKIDSEWVRFIDETVGDGYITLTARALFATSAATHTPSTTSPSVNLAALSDTITDTIYVGSTSGPLPFPNSGIVRINGEYIKYTGKTSTSLTGLTRGLAGGTTAVPHMAYKLVEAQLFSPHYEAIPLGTQIPDFQKQVVSMLKTLEDLLPKDDGDVMSDGASMTTAQKNAAYNYYFVVNDGSYGIHNYQYAMQLLYDSIIDLSGAPPYGRP